MTLAASRLLDIKARYGAEAVVFSLGTPSGTGTSDYWQWLVRLACAFGSPNHMGTAHICLWNRMIGSQYTYGVSTPFPDYDHARCILLWGFNPQASWSYASTARLLPPPAGAETVGWVQTPKAPPSQRLEMLMPTARLYSSSLA